LNAIDREAKRWEAVARTWAALDELLGKERPVVAKSAMVLYLGQLCAKDSDPEAQLNLMIKYVRKVCQIYQELH
jgi:hypothetical protein